MDAESVKRIRVARFRAARELVRSEPDKFRMVYHRQVIRWAWVLWHRQTPLERWRLMWCSPWWYMEGSGEIPKKPYQKGTDNEDLRAELDPCESDSINVRA